MKLSIIIVNYNVNVLATSCCPTPGSYNYSDIVVSPIPDIDFTVQPLTVGCSPCDQYLWTDIQGLTDTLFVDWGEFGGGSVIVGHPLGITSVYKHASEISCVVGDVVKTGDVLGVIGNSGEYSTGIHLHFEMWLNGEALNPEDFLFY